MKTLILIVALAAFSAQASAHGHGGKGERKGKIGKMFENTDANEDGQLDLSEFLANAEARFIALDLNQDGFVTKEEGREAHEQMREERRAERKAKREERRQQRDAEEGDSE